jgi:3-hydroxyacyl-CoA dehydrogenase
MLNIRTVAVIGSGTMGAGIAEVAASHGHQVLIYDIAAMRFRAPSTGSASVWPPG